MKDELTIFRDLCHEQQGRQVYEALEDIFTTLDKVVTFIIDEDKEKLALALTSPDPIIRQLAERIAKNESRNRDK